MVIGILILGVKFQPQNAMYLEQGNTHNSKALLSHVSCLLVVYEFHMGIVHSQLYYLLFTLLNMLYKKSISIS